MIENMLIALTVYAWKKLNRAVTKQHLFPDRSLPSGDESDRVCGAGAQLADTI